MRTIPPKQQNFVFDTEDEQQKAKQLIEEARNAMTARIYKETGMIVKITNPYVLLAALEHYVAYTRGMHVAYGPRTNGDVL